MKIKCHRQILILLIIFFSAGICHSKRLIKIGYVEFPPMTYTNNEKKPDGILIALADKVLSRLNYSWVAYSYPAKRMAMNLVNGDIDLWIGLSTLPEFKSTTYVSKSIVNRLSLRAYSIGNKPPVHSVEDLFDQTVIILGGYSYGGWINVIKNPANQVSFIEVNTHKHAFERLIHLKNNGRDAYLLDYKHPSEKVLKTMSVPDLHYNEISSLDVHFVVSKKSRNARMLLNQLENAFLELNSVHPRMR